MLNNSKKENTTIIKWFAITMITSLVSIIILLSTTGLVDFNSSDGGMFLWFFGIFSVVLGLIAGVYKYNKFKKEKGIDVNEEISAEEEFEIQVKDYDSLSITKSKRGQAVLAISFFVCLTLIFAFFDVVPMLDALVAVIVYGILSIFIYKGHRWAMVSTMFMWTLDKGYQMIQLEGKVIIGVFFWWLFLMSLLYSSILIENSRRKNVNKKNSKDVQKKIFNEQYCSECGNKISKSSKFCKYCGKKSD